MATLAYLSMLLLAGVNTEEVATPASLLGPRNFNHHAFAVNQYLKEIEPTRQGPVLFPNDAPPPPRPPLIVTSRPLTESIARSELNPIPPENNSIASPSSVNHVSFKPEFRLKPGFLTRIKPQLLARVKGYQQFAYPVVTPVPFDYGAYDDGVKQNLVRDNRYDYEEQSSLPPIYKVLSNHAKQNVFKQQKPQNYYQVKEPDYSHRYKNNDVRDENNSEDNQDSNYAFSYRVNDRKTGDDFSHSQQSSGSSTNGEYRVRLPDGRMQIVSYTADENGYKADVRYDDDDKTAGNAIDNHNNDIYNHNTHKNNDINDNRRDYVQDTKNYVTADVNRYNDNTNYNYDSRNDYNDNNHDYVQNTAVDVNYKPIKDDYNQYSDLSKEYYNNDYSLEYDGKNDNFGPHTSKFTAFAPKNTKIGTIVVPKFRPRKVVSASTVRPSYEELKDLFVTKRLYNQPTVSYYKNPVEINTPSTTPSPNNFDTTEHVVIIGTNKPNLYTNIRNVPLTVTPSPIFTPNTFVTPSSYLENTIASLKNRNNAKPVLSESFINRINKYITFN